MKKPDWKVCDWCDDDFTKRRAAVCMACGKKFILCVTCWQSFNGCSIECEEKLREILKGVLWEPLRSPHVKPVHRAGPHS